MTLLHELAILPPETIWTDTSVPETRILVDASTAVQARIVYTFVLVHASFVVRRWDSPFSASNKSREEFSYRILCGSLTGVKTIYPRAIVLVPKIDTFEGFRTNDVGARLVRGTIPFQIPGHRRLTPLRSIHGRW